MPMYKVMACGSTTRDNELKASCGWVLECNAIGVGLKNSCPTCGNHLVFAQSSDPALLLEWCAEKQLEIPRWLMSSVPVG